MRYALIGVAFSVGFIVGPAVFTALRRSSRAAQRLADPTPTAAERFTEGLKAGLATQVREDGATPIEVEYAYEFEPGQGSRIALRYYPHLVAALAAIATDPEIRSDGFRGIVITNLESE